MTVDWTKPICFPDDPRPARVLATDLKGERPVAVAVLQRDGSETIFTFHPDGTYGGTHDYTIINVPEPPKTRDVFVVFSPWGSNVYDSIETVMAFTSAHRPCTIHQLRLVDDGAEHLLPPDGEGSS